VPWIQYTATGGQTVFAVPYIFFATTDLQVYDTPVGTVANDTTNLIAINANYTVTLNPITFTGSITLVVPATAGDIITIVRNMPNTRTNFYVQGSPITFDTLNYDAEASELQIQQNNYIVNNRMPRYQFTNQPVYPRDILLPILGANEIWVKDPTNSFISVQTIPGGTAILPTITNHIATFADTIGTIQSTAGIINGANISNLTWQGATVTVPFGGTGNTTFTPYAVITAGTSPTGNFQNVTGLGTIGFVLTSTGPGSLPTWQTTGAVTGVSSVTGTAGQITAVPTTGNVIVGIDPAYLGQASITTLGTITTGVWHGSVIPLANGGSNANLVASNGGLVYSTATAMAILAGTATANQIPLSGSNAAPTWSTATYPATTTINQVLYSSAANTISGLATANRAVMTTTAAGVPVMTALATDGQLIIGSTAGAPAAATLIAGPGINIANGSNTITLSVAGAGFTWTDVTGAAQALSIANGYVTDRGAGVTYTLPATANLGDEISIIGKLGLATIAQNANQQICLGNTNSTVGVGGSFTATNVGDCINLICITPGASTVWRAGNSVGNWTIA
jgi:hypothetical protein